MRQFMRRDTRFPTLLLALGCLMLVTFLASPLFAETSEAFENRSEASEPEASPLDLGAEKTSEDEDQFQSEPAKKKRLVNFEEFARIEFPTAGSVRHQPRTAWIPLFDFAYHWQRDVTTNTGTMHGLRADVRTPTVSPWQIGLSAFLDNGKVDGRSVRRGGITGYAGVLYESGEDDTLHQDEPRPERDDYLNLERRRNFHEVAIGIEYGLVEMKRFINLDDRTYGGFRAGVQGRIGFYGFSLHGGVAAEVYTSKTLYDSRIFVGFGQPWLPFGVSFGYRNLTVKGYHGSFLVLAFEFRF